MNKRDLILMASLAAAAVILFVIFAFARGQAKGSKAVITWKGQIYGTYDLYEERTITLQDDTGKNVLVIKDGFVQMTEADCPDHYCMEKGAVSGNGETIVCLPHRLVVQMIDETSSHPEVDVIAQ